MKIEFYFLFLLVISCADVDDKILNSGELKDNIYGIDRRFNTHRQRKHYVDSIYHNHIRASTVNYTIDNLFVIANGYYNINERSSYSEVTDKLLELSKIQKNDFAFAKANVYKGNYFSVQNNPDSSFKSYYTAKKIFIRLGDEAQIANVLTKMARLKVIDNDWIGGEDYAQQALKIYIKLNDTNKQADLYNILGFISSNLGQYSDADVMYLRALSLIDTRINPENPHQREVIEYNLAHSYLQQSLYQKADVVFAAILKLPTVKTTSPYLYSGTLASYAQTQHRLFPFKRNVANMFKQAIQLHDSLKFVSHSIINRCKFSEYYISIQDTTSADILSRQAYQLSKTQNDKSLEILALQQLILTDPNNASAYSKEYIALNDSLQIAERKIRNKFARIEFETDQLQIERDRAIVDSGAFYNMFFIFLILIGAITYWVYRRMGYSLDQEAKFQARADGELFDSLAIQRSKVMEGRIFEKERISRELHDGVLNDLSFVRNSLAIVIDKGDLSSKLKGCKKYLNQLQIIEKEIHTISHDLKGSNILKAQSFRKLVDDFCELQHTASEINWSFEHDVAIKWKKVNSKLKVNIYRILQEAVQNINRHSYASYASIYIFLKEGKIHIHISDDGIGFKSATKAMGTGLKNIQTRADLQGGHVEIQAIKGEGMKIFLEFPY